MKRALELEDDKMIKKWPPQENHLAAHCGVVRSGGHLVAREMEQMAGTYFIDSTI